MHDEAPTAAATDWPQILALYEVLMQASDNPVVALNHAVAAAMVHGPRIGIDLLGNAGADQRIAAGHQLHAARANLLEMAGGRDLGTIRAKQAHYDSAGSILCRAATLYRETCDLHGQADALTNLGTTLAERAKLKDAVAALRHCQTSAAHGEI